MTIIEDSSFGVVDYCFFGAMLLISLGIGAVATLKGNKSAEEFLMGNRTFGPFPVALSLLTSFISAISLLGFTGETYAYGMQIIWYVIGIVLGISAAVITILPVIHPLKLISVNEYLLLRFKSPVLCKFITVITTLKGIIYMGIALYAPTLALASVTPLSSSYYILILGCVVTLYSSTGGIRAVIWTDVFQLTVMFLGLVIILGVGCYEVGGPMRVWNTALEGQRLNIFDVTPSLYVRHTLWNTIIWGFVGCYSFFGVSQINVQRLCAVPSMKDAQIVLIINIVGMVSIYLLIFIGGVILYSAYADCDPWSLGLLKKKEEILPHFMVDRLSFLVGLPGIFVATIVGGALSSISSTINANVAMIWKDCLLPMKIFSNVKPRTASIINTILSFFMGGLAIGCAFLSKTATNLVQFSSTISSATLGPILGVFVLGIFFPKVNTKGAWGGVVLAALLNGWITSGGFLYKPISKPLPLSTEGCPSLGNETTLEINEITTTSSYLTYQNSTTDFGEEDLAEDFPLMKLYGISYTLYGLIGTMICIIGGLLVSCLTGNQDIKEVAPRHISPWVHKMYWDKEALDKAYSEEEIVYKFQENSSKGIKMRYVQA